MRCRYLIFLFCVISSSVAAGQAPAEDADGDIQYRQNVMRALGGHTSAMALIVTGEGGNERDLRVHADAVIGLAAMVPSLFPEGSDAGRTNALLDIWLEPARFRQRLTEFERGVAGLGRNIARGRREFAQAFQALAVACKGCHDRYKSQ